MATAIFYKFNFEVVKIFKNSISLLLSFSFNKKYFLSILFQDLVVFFLSTSSFNCRDAKYELSGLYYKQVTIIIYDRNDSGQYYKTTITIVIDDPSLS
jgi:hypothetical protein